MPKIRKANIVFYFGYLPCTTVCIDIFPIDRFGLYPTPNLGDLPQRSPECFKGEFWKCNVMGSLSARVLKGRLLGFEEAIGKGQNCNTNFCVPVWKGNTRCDP